MEHGASAVHAAVVHGVFSGGAIANIATSPIKQLIVTDSIADVKQKAEQCPKITVLSVKPPRRYFYAWYFYAWYVAHEDISMHGM